MHDQNLHESALRFYARNQGQHLVADRKKLIERCTDHISFTFNATALAAEDIALRAFGEFESRGERCYVDISRSTAYAVFVTDPETGIRRVFTVADLVAMIPKPRSSGQVKTRTARLSAVG